VCQNCAKKITAFDSALIALVATFYCTDNPIASRSGASAAARIANVFRRSSRRRISTSSRSPMKRPYILIETLELRDGDADPRDTAEALAWACREPSGIVGTVA